MTALPVTYTFRPHEKISDGFVRVLRELSTRARSLTRRSRKPTVESIHEGRLLIKRLRALLWFARPALVVSTHARVRMQLRKAAQLLAGHRDLAVAQSTLENLTKKASKARDRTALTHVSQSLAQAQPSEKMPHPPLKKAIALLCQSVNEIKRTTDDHAPWPTPSQRLEKAFRTSHKAGKKARRTGKDTDFHAWRKKAKRLLYQLELTQAEPGRQIVRTIKRAAKLQDSLGIYHDYVVVEGYLQHIFPLASSTQRVEDLLKKKKRRLKKKACKIARHLDISI